MCVYGKGGMCCMCIGKELGSCACINWKCVWGKKRNAPVEKVRGGSVYGRIEVYMKKGRNAIVEGVHECACMHEKGEVCACALMHACIKR